MRVLKKEIKIENASGTPYKGQFKLTVNS